MHTRKGGLSMSDLPERDYTHKPIIQCFQDELNVVINTYRDEGLTLGEAVGALELVKLDLWKEQEDV